MERLGHGGGPLANAMDKIATNVWDLRFTVGVGSLCIYAILVGMTIIYLFMYIKRMLTVAFLIIIAPLITITYSIDKMGDGRSQALNTWLKEFIFNILIQPFHCIIYMVFVTTAMNLLAGNPTLYGSVLAVLMLMFTFQAEKIVKKIFNFESSSLSDAIGSTAAITAGIGFLRGVGNKSNQKGQGVNKIPNMEEQTMFPGNSQQGNGGGTSSKPQDNQNTQTSQNGTEGQQPPTSQNGTGNSQSQNTTASGPQANGAGQGEKGTRQAPKKNRPGRIGGAIKSYLKSSARLAGIAAGAMLGASTGTGKGIAGGAYAGSSVYKGIASEMNEFTADRRTKKNERTFAGAYLNYQAQSGLDDDKMEAFTQRILEGNEDPDKLDDNAKLYYSYVQKMKNTYATMGVEDSDDRVMNTVKNISNPEYESDRIKPKYEEQ